MSRTTARRSAKPTVTTASATTGRKLSHEEADWMDADAAKDAEALIALCEFLHKRGLRTSGSACQDAMNVIVQLEEEARSLKAKLAQ